MDKKRKYNVVSKCVHMSISVDGVLNNYKKSKKVNFCEEDNGMPMNPKKAYQLFELARYEGKKVLPMSKECYRFDYQKGCKGHIKSIMPNEEKMNEIKNEILKIKN